MTAKKEDANKSITRYAEMKKQRLHEEDERHKTAKENLTNEFDPFVEDQKMILQKREEELEARKVLVEKSMNRLSAYLKANFPNGEEKPAPEAEVAKAATPARLNFRCTNS